jgi:hypothetical protein
MALTKCKECGGEISDKALNCPHCGNPIRTEQSAVISVEPPQQEQIITEVKPMASSKRWTKVASFSIGLFALAVLVFFLLVQIVPANAFVQKIIQSAQNIQNAFSKIVSEISGNEQSISPLREASSQPAPSIDPLEIQNNPDGSKIYPVQYNNLWGHEFYTSKIDQSGSIDIGSEPKQSIAKLLNSLGFPPTLTKNLIFVHIDPTITKTTDRLKIPWAGGNVYISLQPQGGTYQNVYGGSVIALNNLAGYNPAVLVHELGHLIGSQLTDDEWKQYYKLRGIPSDTPRNSSNWNSSPSEDFAEVYKNTYGYGNVQTQYGILVPTSDFAEFSTPCYTIKEKLVQDYIAKNKDPNQQPWNLDFQKLQDDMKKAEAAIQANAELQSCRRKNNGTDPFGSQIYTVQISESTKQFVRNIVARLNSGR